MVSLACAISGVCFCVIPEALCSEVRKGRRRVMACLTHEWTAHPLRSYLSVAGGGGFSETPQRGEPKQGWHPCEGQPACGNVAVGTAMTASMRQWCSGDSDDSQRAAVAQWGQ